jgi:chorismate mutase
MVLEGEERGLSEEFVLKLFKAIHQESINHQEQIVKA